MSAFKALRDASNKFENELRKIELVCPINSEKFEDVLVKKIKDLSLYSSKLKLLKARVLASTPHIKEQQHIDSIAAYGDTVASQIQEQVIVKILTQSHTIKGLIITPNSSLHPELIERKEAIVAAIIDYQNKEIRLRDLEAIMTEKEAEHAALRSEWDNTLGVLRDIADEKDKGDLGTRGPLYEKLAKLVGRLELMRWLMCKLVTPRGRCDWLSDPRRAMRVLALTRSHSTIEGFTQCLS